MDYMKYIEFLMDAYGMSEYDAARAADLEFFPNDIPNDNPEHYFSGSISSSGTLCGGGFEDA